MPFIKDQSGRVGAELQLRRGAGAVGAQRIALLQGVEEEGSIAAAARQAGLSYKGAWDAIQVLNSLFSVPLIASQTGGKSGGGASLTEAGRTVLIAYKSMQDQLLTMVDRLDGILISGDRDIERLWRLGMKTSARNSFRGIVAGVTVGAVNAEVVLDIGGGQWLIAIVTNDSVADLELAPGREALALVKASFVLLVPGREPIRTSARNCLTGTVIEHEAGAVNDEVVLDLGDGRRLTAIVTRESGETLGFEVGQPAQALIKASHIILAVD